MIRGGGIPSLTRYSGAQGGRLWSNVRRPKGVLAWKIGKLENWKSEKISGRRSTRGPVGGR